MKILFYLIAAFVPSGIAAIVVTLIPVNPTQDYWLPPIMAVVGLFLAILTDSEIENKSKHKARRNKK